jgi:hypothetical protein
MGITIAGDPSLPTLSQLKAWQTEHFAELADWCEAEARRWEDSFTRVHESVKNADWAGDGKDAAMNLSEKDLYKVRGAGQCLRDAAPLLRTTGENERFAKAAALAAVANAQEAGFTVGEDLSVHDPTDYTSWEQSKARRDQALSLAQDIHREAGSLLRIDQDVAERLPPITASLGDLKFDDDGHDRHVQLVDNKFKDSPGDPAAERRHNQEEAFKQAFGRAPTSAVDWETAAALDPHSYDPRYKGVPPEVRVVRINPVPGQGEVRVSQWIEQRDVLSAPGTRDMGDNRTASPNFDPENARVTTYVDYENGIVVMRQNPSIQLGPDGGPGQVKVGVPQGTVTQTSDGSVRIKYDAGNPFAPGPSRHPPEPFNPWTVNGDLVFTPGSQGVHVDGTRTDYPSMEVYQDLPNGSTHTVLIDPAVSGRSWGPFVNLEGHHDVGIGGRAFEPFDRGEWNPRYDVRVPLPSTDFGPVSSPPSVPTPRPGPGVPA